MKQKYLTLISFLCVALTCVAPLYAQTTARSSAGRSTAASAYSRIAPFVTPDTFLAVRFDLDALDSDAIMGTLDNFFVGFLKEREIDNARMISVNREFRRGLDTLKEKIDVFLEARKTLNVREIFMFVQNQNDESVRFFIPLSNSKKEAVKDTLALLASFFGMVDVPGGLAFVTDSKSDAAIYKKLEPKENVRLKSFFERSTDSSIQIYCKAFKFRQILARGNAEIGDDFDRVLEQFPAETRDALTAFDSYFQELNVSIDVNAFTIRTEMIFTTPERAEQFRGGLEALANHLVDQEFDDEVEAARVLFPEASNENIAKYNLNSLSKEIIRASAIKLIPKRVGPALTFEMTPDAQDVMHNSAMLQILLTPFLESALEVR